MMKLTLVLIVFCSIFQHIQSQTLLNNFEPGSTHLNWTADDCGLQFPVNNPYNDSVNPSSQVLRYHDVGGSYANIRFDLNDQYKLSTPHQFRFLLYVPSSGLSGNAPLQVSLKLQRSANAQPWTDQTEIIKTIVTDTWQTLSFNFLNDPYINASGASPAPAQRTDLNRLLIQINGEGNNHQVLAFIDNFEYTGELFVQAPPPVYDYLVWSDEFSGNGPVDASKWFHQTLLPNGDSWYNGELQHYTNRTENSYLEGGYLHIKAKRENFSDQGVMKNFTGARLNSKFAFTYGRIETRVKLPSGAGTWPAIWMLGRNIQEPGGFFTSTYGTTPWPACGEIDIMEHWGNNQNYVQSAIHTPSSFGATVNHGGLMAANVSQNFHRFTCVWSPDEITFSLNDQKYYTYRPTEKNAATWPFFEPQYFLLNVAMQGSVAANFTESEMVIDYIRVYQQQPNAISEAGLSDTRIFPNPGNENLVHITTGFHTETKQVTVFDYFGKEIHTGQFSGNNTKLELPEIPSGMYFIRLNDGKNLNTLKWLKR